MVSARLDSWRGPISEYSKALVTIVQKCSLATKPITSTVHQLFLVLEVELVIKPRPIDEHNLAHTSIGVAGLQTDGFDGQGA